MCGIIGYVGSREAKDLLLRGLERLEYRGYDSAGIALREEEGLDYVRAVGNLQFLKDAAGPNGSTSRHGLGHTRWATHGAVTEQNAHPLTGCNGEHLAIVLNGIVENYRELKGSLLADGHMFTSETDAEVVAHLIERHYAGDLIEAVRAAYADLEGHFAFVTIHHDHSDLLVGARRQRPLDAGVVGRYIIEEWARVPVEPDIASEWRYRNPVLSKDTVVIGISQSGETADTIAAMQLAREQGAHTLAITNQMGTQIAREVDAVLYTRAGLEMGVAATKTFTSQVALLSLIALKLAQLKRTMPDDEIAFILEELYDLPSKMIEFLDG